MVKEYDEAAEGDLVAEFAFETGVIHADLSIGADLTETQPLMANLGLCAVGMKTIGAGFLVERTKAEALGLGQDNRIRPYINGRDLMGRTRGVYVIDLFGVSEEDVRDQYPKLYQHLRNAVYDIRRQNNNRVFRDLWWVIGHPRPIFREFTRGLKRYVVTLETAKHQVFQFLDSSIVPDSTIVTFGTEDVQ